MVLDGSISATSENVLIYATSNRRHLMPEYMQENLEYKHVGEEIHPGETSEEKISLSERFGLWVSFYPFDQDDYLGIVATGWRNSVARRAKSRPRTKKRCSGRCSRGSRCGRVAWQFARDVSGRLRARRRSAQPSAVEYSPGRSRRRGDRAAGRIFLLAQRPAGKVYAGYWEFPGGKVEPGEPLAAALARELHEELGIDVERAYPWIVRTYVYPHAAVRLNFFRVRAWQGEAHGKEAQRLAWQHVSALEVAPLLPANAPVLRALQLPFEYAITHAGEIGRRRS